MLQWGQVTTSWQDRQEAKVWYPLRFNSTMDCRPCRKFSTRACSSTGPMALPLPGMSSRFRSTSST